jgi:hypothetical protein
MTMNNVHSPSPRLNPTVIPTNLKSPWLIPRNPETETHRWRRFSQCPRHIALTDTKQIPILDDLESWACLEELTRFVSNLPILVFADRKSLLFVKYISSNTNDSIQAVRRIVSAQSIHCYCKLIAFYFICAICPFSRLIRNQDTKLPFASSPSPCPRHPPTRRSHRYTRQILLPPNGKSSVLWGRLGLTENAQDWVCPCYFVFYSRLHLEADIFGYA